MAEALDFEQTSVGLKADLPEGWQVTQPFAEGEITRVIDGGLGACAHLRHVRDLFEILPPQQNLWVDSGSGSRPRL